LRLLLTLALLLYASLLDWRRREIDDRSWMGLVGLGFAFFAYDLYTLRSWLLVKFFAISVGSALVLAVLLYYTGVMGGGDGRILIGLGAVYPLYPAETLSVFPVFVLSVFSNAVFLAALVPLGFFAMNIRRLKEVRSPREFLLLFLGYPKRAREVSEFEAVMGDEGRYSLFLDARTVQLGKKEDSDGLVWVSPAIPFLVFITLGFVLSYLGIDIFTRVLLNWPPG